MKTNYTGGDLKVLTSVLRRGAPNAKIEHAELRTRLMDLLVAVGRADDGDAFGRTFNMLAAAAVPHAELAERYRAISASDDPFRELEIIETIRRDLRAFLRARSRSRRSRQRRHDGAASATAPLGLRSQDDEAALRQHAAGLAYHHQSLTRPGPPKKSMQDTLLIGLADIYLEVTDRQLDRYDLPHAETSNFIAFAHVAIRPFLLAKGATRKALSSRWKRLKDERWAKPLFVKGPITPAAKDPAKIASKSLKPKRSRQRRSSFSSRQI